MYLNVCRHEACPVAASGYPGTYFAGAFWVAVEQIGVDRGRDNHDTNTLHGCKDGYGHVVPLVLKSETEEDKTDTKHKSGRIEIDEADFWVEATVVPSGAVAANGVVDELACKPANNDTNDSKEVKVAYNQLIKYKRN